MHSAALSQTGIGIPSPTPFQVPELEPEKGRSAWAWTWSLPALAAGLIFRAETWKGEECLQVFTRQAINTQGACFMCALCFCTMPALMALRMHALSWVCQPGRRAVCPLSSHPPPQSHLPETSSPRYVPSVHTIICHHEPFPAVDYGVPAGFPRSSGWPKARACWSRNLRQLSLLCLLEKDVLAHFCRPSDLSSCTRLLFFFQNIYMLLSQKKEVYKQELRAVKNNLEVYYIYNLRLFLREISASSSPAKTCCIPSASVIARGIYVCSSQGPFIRWEA